MHCRGHYYVIYTDLIIKYIMLYYNINNNSKNNNDTDTHLAVATAVLYRASWQDDSAGHEGFQQSKQDQVKVDLAMRAETVTVSV